MCRCEGVELALCCVEGHLSLSLSLSLCMVVVLLFLFLMPTSTVVSFEISKQTYVLSLAPKKVVLSHFCQLSRLCCFSTFSPYRKDKQRKLRAPYTDLSKSYSVNDERSFFVGNGSQCKELHGRVVQGAMDTHTRKRIDLLERLSRQTHERSDVIMNIIKTVVISTCIFNPVPYAFARTVSSRCKRKVRNKIVRIGQPLS